MARVADAESTFLSDNEIAGTGLGTSPKSIRSYGDLQRAVFELQPADTADAQASAESAANSAATAQEFAEEAGIAALDAGERADAAQARADDAYDRADAAYERADTKVAQDVGPAFAAMTGTGTRTTMQTYDSPTASATYDAVQIQILMDSVQAAQRRLKAVIDDLRANGALTS